MRASLVLAFLVVPLVAGCEEATNAYMYRPAVHANAQASGYPAANYEIPANQPTGNVRIVSFGMVAVRPRGGGQARPVLHVRMIVANSGDANPWTVDTRQVQAAVGGQAAIPPAAVNTNAGQPPIVQIGRGEQRTIDLFYQLPGAVSSEDRLPAFDVVWQVNTGAGPVAQRTPFEREALPNEYEYAGGYYGYPYDYYSYGPYWWYDPLFPDFAFLFPPFVFEHEHFHHGHEFAERGFEHGFHGHEGFHGHGGELHGHGFAGNMHGFHGGGFHGGGMHGGFGGMHGGGFGGGMHGGGGFGGGGHGGGGGGHR